VPNPALTSGLLTDLYQLTMPTVLEERQGRTGGGLSVDLPQESIQRRVHDCRRVGDCIRFLLGFGFQEPDLVYLGTLKGRDGKPLFEPAFLGHLGKLHLKLDVDAIPEGTVVFPQEPLVRVRGPILQGQLVKRRS